MLRTIELFKVCNSIEFLKFEKVLKMFLNPVPPQRVLIMDGSRSVVRGEMAGPFEEDADVELICRTEGGKF